MLLLKALLARWLRHLLHFLTVRFKGLDYLSTLVLLNHQFLLQCHRARSHTLLSCT
ncbi:hypothetical protein M6B38_159505 [Iris pallida]|uniref:Uncharacterized protein n=1 Tax=Iris pallida TaxID=29817 RepID=A0AAX6F0L2_IRIPA|nr:hypothetical protein M6B38_159505 [Iris pallida]